MMKCPECGKEMAKGQAKASNGNSLTDAFTFMTWYPENQKGKLFKNGAVNLRLKATAYYCDECMKVFAEFDIPVYARQIRDMFSDLQEKYGYSELDEKWHPHKVEILISDITDIEMLEEEDLILKLVRPEII